MITALEINSEPTFLSIYNTPQIYCNHRSLSVGETRSKKADEALQLGSPERPCPPPLESDHSAAPVEMQKVTL